MRQELTTTEHQGVVGTSYQLAQQTPHEKESYSGKSTAIKKWGIGDAITQANELHWQQGVGGDKNKIEQFRDVVGALQDFKTYLFMKIGSAFCTVVHSPMKFVAIMAATQQLQGRIIGFVGDQTLTKEPTPILLPPRKAWEWIRMPVATDGPALLAHYQADPSKRGTLWTPPVGSVVTETTVPCLLYIPLTLFDNMHKEGHPLMPHEIPNLIMSHVERSPEDQAAEIAQAWHLLVQWCVVAAQHNGQGDSLVAFSVDAITKMDDACFCQWAETRINGTMGTRPTTLRGPTIVPSVDAHPQANGQFAAELGRGVALGIQALGPY